MLKALRASSVVVVILASCATVLVIVFGFKENPEARAWLQRPGILATIRDSIDNAVSQDGATPPLVAQAHLFAMRIDPPEIVIVTRETKDQDGKTNTGGSGSTNEGDDPLPPPPPRRFNLLATVLYESAPEKSLALFETGDKQEWFHPGETVDRYRIKEIKDGRVLLAQPGQGLQEVSVPPKSNGTSLLKNS